MRNMPAFLLMVALVAGAGCNRRGSAALRDGEMEGMDAMTLSRPPLPPSHPSSPVHSISLPHDEAYAPPGPGRAAFVTACIVCHSPRYITSQPPFSRAVWKGIVQKMIDTFGAHITPAQAAEIVDYLAATNGAHRIGGEGE
jgi:sulfite dehydrogenase (cytochrome) subunit B